MTNIDWLGTLINVAIVVVLTLGVWRLLRWLPFRIVRRRRQP